MARPFLTILTSFFLVIIIMSSQYLQSIEGRTFTSKINKQYVPVSIDAVEETPMPPSPPPPPPTVATNLPHAPPPPSGHVDNFRPTTPGRSPGIGHSIPYN